MFEATQAKAGNHRFQAKPPVFLRCSFFKPAAFEEFEFVRTGGRASPIFETKTKREFFNLTQGELEPKAKRQLSLF